MDKKEQIARMIGATVRGMLPEDTGFILFLFPCTEEKESVTVICMSNVSDEAVRGIVLDYVRKGEH